MTKAEAIGKLRSIRDQLDKLITQADRTPEDRFEEVTMELEKIADDLESAIDATFIVADEAVGKIIASDAASVDQEVDDERSSDNPQGVWKSQDFA